MICFALISLEHCCCRTENCASGRILVNCLTNNVTKEHIAEIFGIYGKINCIEIVAPEKSYGRAVYQQMTIEYNTTSEAHKAIKYMNGGGFHTLLYLVVIRFFVYLIVFSIGYIS